MYWFTILSVSYTLLRWSPGGVTCFSESSVELCLKLKYPNLNPKLIRLPLKAEIKNELNLCMPLILNCESSDPQVTDRIRIDVL